MASSSETSTGLDAKKISIQENTSSRLFRRKSPQKRTASSASLDRLFETGHENESFGPWRHSASDDAETLDTYGVYELRDGFFDAVFFPPEEIDVEDLMWHAKLTLPYAFRKQDPLSITNFFPRQLHEVKSVLHRVTQTRAGIKLIKSFLGYFIAYILCLVPPIRSWLGPFSYIMPISALLNHPGRALGAQVEGTILTIIGTAVRILWPLIIALGSFWRGWMHVFGVSLRPPFDCVSEIDHLSQEVQLIL